MSARAAGITSKTSPGPAATTCPRPARAPAQRAPAFGFEAFSEAQTLNGSNVPMSPQRGGGTFRLIRWWGRGCIASLPGGRGRIASLPGARGRIASLPGREGALRLFRGREGAGARLLDRDPARLREVAEDGKHAQSCARARARHAAANRPAGTCLDRKRCLISLETSTFERHRPLLKVVSRSRHGTWDMSPFPGSRRLSREPACIRAGGRDPRRTRCRC